MGWIDLVLISFETLTAKQWLPHPFLPFSWQWVTFQDQILYSRLRTPSQWDNIYSESLGTLVSHFPLNHISTPVLGVSMLHRESIKLCMGTNWYSELKVVLIINFPPLHYPVMIQMNNWKFNIITVTQNVSEYNISPSFLGIMGCHGWSKLKRMRV